MSIRKPSLDQWFLHYQLCFYTTKYVHLPYSMDVEITELVHQAEKQGIRFSPTATIVKALAIVAERLPHLNRLLFHTPLGMRIAEPEEIRINLPVIIENDGSPVLSAMVLCDLENKDVPTIQQEIRTFACSNLSDKPIGRFAMRRKNTWYNRLILRMIHFLVYRWPSIYLKRGGAFSVTSLIRRDVPNLYLRGTGISATGSTVTVNGLKHTADDRYTLLLGLDFNHSILSGDEFAQLCATLVEVLTTLDVNVFYPEGASDPEVLRQPQ